LYLFVHSNATQLVTMLKLT